MSIEAIYTALEARLAVMTPALSTALPGVAFQPASGDPYQSVDHLPLDPDDAEVGSAGHWERGIMQVTLRYPANAGDAAINARAWMLLQQFRRGLTFTSGGVTVHVTRAPARRPDFIAQARLCRPVDIYWHARVSTA